MMKLVSITMVPVAINAQVCYKTISLNNDAKNISKPTTFTLFEELKGTIHGGCMVSLVIQILRLDVGYLRQGQKIVVVSVIKSRGREFRQSAAAVREIRGTTCSLRPRVTGVGDDGPY